MLLAVTGAIGFNYLNTGKVVEEINVENTDVAQIDSVDDKERKIGVVESDQVEVDDFTKLDADSEIEQSVKLPSKEFQYFTINSSKEESITGKEGTIITFKANSFDVPKNSLLKIRLKEYYKMSDIAFSNLTTETKDGKLIETGGMVYVDAKLKNKEVQLKKGEDIALNFPFEKKKEGMKTFNGETQKGNVVWNEAIENRDVVVERFEEVEQEVYTIVEKMPEFKGGQRGLRRFISKSLRYPAEAREKGIAGKVYVNFTIGKNGKARDAKILRGIHPLLDKAALDLIDDMPNWIPGSQRGKDVQVSYNLPVNFGLGESIGFAEGEDMKNFGDSVVSQLKGDIEKDIEKVEKEGVEGLREQMKVKSDLNYYLLASSNLGWINCDKFIRNNSRRIAFRVKAGDDQVNVKLIFKSVKGIMAGYHDRGIYRFNKIPLGEKATVLAIKFIDNKPFVCLQDVEVSQSIIDLKFEVLTKEKLAEYVKRIDNLGSVQI